MKKKLMLIQLIMLMLIIPATVNAGSVNLNFDSDDDMHVNYFAGCGGSLTATLTFVDYGDNPYGYGVDTTLFESKTSYTGSGMISIDTFKTDNYVPMYGAAGQESHSYVTSSDTGYLEWRDWANYAEFASCEYSFSATNFGATGAYEIGHQLLDSDHDGASFWANGEGSADIKLQGSKAGGTDSYFNMGCLPVCGDGEAWDNNYATFTGSGSGTFSLDAWADNSLFVHEGGISIPGDGSDDSAQYHLSISYSGDWTYPDFGVKGD